MDKVVKVVNLKDKVSDYSFWITKSYVQRLEAIEQLRLQYIKYLQHVEPGLQRVCRVINKKQS